MDGNFSHLDAQGKARMVDVGAKPEQRRRATAVSRLFCAATTIEALQAKALPKGDVLAVARIAAIQAAKMTSTLIPLCHQLPLDQVAVEFQVMPDFVEVQCTVSTTSRTGVEMEALTGASVAALTLYDMMKAVDKGMVIGETRVVEKVKE